MSAPTASVRFSTRATRLRIVIRADRIEVVAPRGVSVAQAQAFLAQHQHEVIARQSRLQQRQTAVQHRVVDWQRTPLWQGQAYPLNWQVSPSVRGLRLSFDEGRFNAVSPSAWTRVQQQQALRDALERFYRRQAALHAQRCITHHALRLGLQPCGLTIRAAQTRWGSCSARGDISLNWRLILAPPAALEYVVVHELCHLRHRNHSAAFWALLAEHLPDYATQRQRLRSPEGIALLSYLAVDAKPD